MAAFQPSPTPKPIAQVITPPKLKIDEDKLWTTINTWKKQQDGYEYKLDQTLCIFAKNRSLEIQSEWSHDKFEKISQQITDETGFPLLGENLSKDIFYPEEALAQWLESPTHKANLDASFTHSCIKCTDGYCVQLFARY